MFESFEFLVQVNFQLTQVVINILRVGIERKERQVFSGVHHRLVTWLAAPGQQKNLAIINKYMKRVLLHEANKYSFNEPCAPH